MTPAEDAEGVAAENPAEDMEDMDPGLARERTELAWTRTALSFAALGGAMLKVSPLGGVLVLAVSGLVWETGRLVRRSGRPGAPGQRRMLLLITIAVTVASLVALAVALLAPGKSPLTPH
jgi:uncharacterized membrane protein YidH (DUF202 family)